MSKSVHAVYIVFLVVSGFLSTIVLGVRGFGFYTTPLEQRPYHPQYEVLKPTGYEGHAYGIFGTLMIMAGVTMYSTRKRVRMFANMGKIKHYLEFHIFLCLVGPMLVLYHTTFKFGGIVAVSFWSMTAVVLSGLVGRYFYVQIPKGIHGNELSIAELNAENENLSTMLTSQFGLGGDVLRAIDAVAKPPKRPAEMSFLDVMRFFIASDLTRRGRLRMIMRHIERRTLRPDLVRRVRKLVGMRVKLTRRIAFLEKFKQIFHYWHAVHLPFTVVMFAILLIHVGVAIAFGYTWIF